MKNKAVKMIAAILALVMLVIPTASCASCSEAEQAVLTLGENKISYGVYSLMTSVFKGSLAASVGSSVSKDSFWDTVVSTDPLKTQEEMYNELMLNMAKDTLYKLALFDEKGLSLPQSAIDAIDEEIDFWIDYDGEGSKNNFNAILGNFGANVDILREYMIMSAKIEYLVSYLYGGGEKISDAIRQDYLEEKYVSFKQIMIPYYRYVYVTDSNGDDVYYTSDGKIAYDVEEGIPLDPDGDGTSNRDKNGDVIYYKDVNGKPHIAYDTETGTRKLKLDQNGNPETVDYTSAEKSAAWERAQSVYTKMDGKNGNFHEFESLMLVYDESYSAEEDVGDGRMYLNTDVDYSNLYGDDTISEIVEEVSKVDVGEVTIYESEYGMHIVMRYGVEDKAWDNEAYAGYFVDETGYVDFEAKLINYLFSLEVARAKDKYGDVTVDEEQLGKISIRDIGINYNFY